MTKDSENSESLTASSDAHVPKIVPSKSDRSGVNGNEKKYELKVYKTRWIVVALFMFYSGMSTFQWVQYSIVSNIVSRYEIWEIRVMTGMPGCAE